MWDMRLAIQLTFWGVIAWFALAAVKNVRDSREQIAREESLLAEQRHREIVENLEKIIEALEAIEANQ